MSEAAGDTRAGSTAVSGAAASEGELGPARAVRVRVMDGPLVGPVLRRMVSIVLARADWPLDALDDALLICDALSAHAPAHTLGGWVALSVAANEHEAELCVGELTCDGAAQLVRDATLPVAGNVLEGIAERVSVEPMDGEGSRLVLVLGCG